MSIWTSGGHEVEILAVYADDALCVQCVDDRTLVARRYPWDLRADGGVAEINEAIRACTPEVRHAS